MAIALETSSDRRDTGRKSSKSAILVVTAESVPVAVILIVEDDVFIRSDADAMIQDWNHRTLLASDVDEAPLRHVADAFLCAEQRLVEPFV